MTRNYQVCLDIDEFFKDAKVYDIRERVRKRVSLVLNKGLYSEDYLRNVLGYTPEEIDSVEAVEPAWRREARDWSELGGKVFGAEGDE